MQRLGLLSLPVTVILFFISCCEAATISGKVSVPRSANDGNAVVFIDRIPGKSFAPPGKPEVLDQINLKFQPHVMAVLVGTTVLFPNSDVVRHNVFSPPGSPVKVTLGTYPVHTTKQQIFNKPGVVTLLCNIHAEMSAYVVVTETPYFAISDAQGNYSIANVPPGRYVLRAWHERGKPSQQDITIETGDLNSVNFNLK